jgi:hypothetical protein
LSRKEEKPPAVPDYPAHTTRTYSSQHEEASPERLNDGGLACPIARGCVQYDDTGDLLISSRKECRTPEDFPKRKGRRDRRSAEARRLTNHETIPMGAYMHIDA